MFELRSYTQEEYEADLKKELSEKGLFDCVKEACDEIDEEIRLANVGYLTQAGVQELMVKIEDYIRLSEAENE